MHACPLPRAEVIDNIDTHIFYPWELLRTKKAVFQSFTFLLSRLVPCINLQRGLGVIALAW